jgi:hypothetical protein
MILNFDTSLESVYFTEMYFDFICIANWGQTVEPVLALLSGP